MEREWVEVPILQWSEKKPRGRIKEAVYTKPISTHKMSHQWSNQQKIASFGHPAQVKDLEIESLRNFLTNRSKIQLKGCDLQTSAVTEIKESVSKGESAEISQMHNNILPLNLDHIGYRLIANYQR